MTNPTYCATRRLLVLSIVSALLVGSPTLGEVVRFEITERSPFADGMSFGNAGAYERIVGKVYYAIDPALRQNRTIVDLDLAPRNEHGKVEFASDLFILAPKDPSRGNQAILYDVNNRGSKLALWFFNDAKRTNDPKSAEHAGNGFLLRHGFTIVWSGWDAEPLPGNHGVLLSAPVAAEQGKPIVGPVRCEIVPGKEMTRTDVNWAGHGSYHPTKKGLREATLSWRLRPPRPPGPHPTRPMDAACHRAQGRAFRPVAPR